MTNMTPLFRLNLSEIAEKLMEPNAIMEELAWHRWLARRWPTRIKDWVLRAQPPPKPEPRKLKIRIPRDGYRELRIH